MMLFNNLPRIVVAGAMVLACVQSFGQETDKAARPALERELGRVEAGERPSLREAIDVLLPFEPADAKQGDDELRRLKVARYNAALSILEARLGQLVAPPQGDRDMDDVVERLCAAYRRAFDAALALRPGHDDRLALFRKYVDALTQLDATFVEYAKNSAASGVLPAHVDRVHYERLDAQVRLREAGD
jgi:hypothetical protein